MHQEILNSNQKELLPFLAEFNDFGLVGGTGIALQIGHRGSIDFDLFSNKEFKNEDIRKIILKNGKKIDHVFVDQKDEYTVLIDGVKVTFLFYPFKIDFSSEFSRIKMADLLTLSALKAYALGRRAKWKDYVDIYFILKIHTMEEIISKTKEIFGNDFNEKIFRSQLSYFDDIDYSEKVEYLKGSEVSDEEVKKNLKEQSLQ
ncbi:nucleotidyl transferase AbiEii/AbiGii toxin family protein [bacterium]|jgi:hypothetical protein|nr:nucleotidyl transferase AbiEii/AbiGii toxin family protein [bacterium]